MKKKISILPTILTLGNGVCGFASIVVASKIGLTNADPNLFLGAGGLIILAMVFDALDGYAARLTKSASNFGGQLDSLCDAISFGAAPAFLLLKLTQESNRPMDRKVIGVIAALYVMCALLRLARFNVETTPDPNAHKRFKGLPSPAAAGCVASLALVRSELPIQGWTGLNEEFVHKALLLFSPIGTLTVALLMVSRFSYPHFVNQLLRRRRSFSFVVQLVLAVCFLWIVQEFAPLLLFWAYAAYGPVRYALRPMRGGAGQNPALTVHGDPGSPPT